MAGTVEGTNCQIKLYDFETTELVCFLPSEALGEGSAVQSFAAGSDSGSSSEPDRDTTITSVRSLLYWSYPS